MRDDAYTLNKKMGQQRTVQIEKLMQGNERMCLSSNSVFNRCHLCPEYEKKILQKDGTFKIKICESRIENPEAMRQLEEKEKLQQELKNIKKRIKEISI
jgi:hypothetical protein